MPKTQTKQAVLQEIFITPTASQAHIPAASPVCRYPCNDLFRTWIPCGLQGLQDTKEVRCHILSVRNSWNLEIMPHFGVLYVSFFLSLHLFVFGKLAKLNSRRVDNWKPRRVLGVLGQNIHTWGLRVTLFAQENVSWVSLSSMKAKLQSGGDFAFDSQVYFRASLLLSRTSLPLCRISSLGHVHKGPCPLTKLFLYLG